MTIPENYERLIITKNRRTFEVLVPCKTLLAIGLKAICDEDITTDISYVNYNRYVSGEFIRNYIDKSFKSLNMPRNWNKANRTWIRFEAQLWGETWRLIRLLSSTALNTSVETFCELICEETLLCFIKISEETTTTEYIRKIQSENRQLQSLKNPYEVTSYTTHQFIKRCVLEAERNLDFYKDYQRMIRVRMEFITHIKTLRPKLIDQSGNHEHRGFKAK